MQMTIKSKKVFFSVLIALIAMTSTFFIIKNVYGTSVTYYDYNDITQLGAKYSYGTLFYTENTTFETLGDAEATYHSNAAYQKVTWTSTNMEDIKVKITNCAIDEDNELCDVIITIDNIECYDSYSSNTATLEIASSSDPRFGEMADEVMVLWFKVTNGCGVCTIDYYKAGTDEEANINGVVGLFGDIDVYTGYGLTDEFLGGLEGMVPLYDAEIYHNKSGDLQEIDGGISATYGMTNVNGIEKYGTAFVLESEKATFKFKYGGVDCGMWFVFASPYTFELSAPQISVDKEVVYEEEEFIYTISQYIPNNYYSSVINFIDDYDGTYSSFKIEDTLDSNLTITGDITIINESDEDVTDYFDITVSNNSITATLKSEYLDSKDFYQHLYKVQVPVEFNYASGKIISDVDNKASSTVVSNNTETTNYTDEVTVGLKYDVVTTGTIDNGTIIVSDTSSTSIAVDTDTVNHSDTSTVQIKFKAADHYNISSVKINDTEVSLSSLNTLSGYYTYTFTNSDVDENIEQNIVITTQIVQSDVAVRYVDYYTGKELANSISTTYDYGESYTTEQKSISGYTYYTDTGNTSGTVEDENIEVVYYYKKNTSVVAYYIDKYTGETIASTVTISGKQGDSYKTEQKSVSGYEFVEVEGDTEGSMSSDPITVTYYYVKQSDVTVKYVDYYTGKEIETGENETYSQGDTYNTEQKTISGYTFYTDTGNTSGTVEDKDIEVIYYYKKNTSVIAEYVDMITGDIISSEVKITGVQGDDYTTSKKEIDGYEYIEYSGKAEGQMEADTITVTYKYKKQSNLITEHIDANSGEQIIDDVVKTYKEGDIWESYAQNFEGYVLVESPDITTGTMEREDITKTYYYKKISAGLVVKYVDVITGDLLDQETYEGNEKDTITLDEKTFKYYVIYSRPDYTTIDLTVEAQEVIYYYIRIADIDIIGIDKDTGETLYETSKSGLEGDEYTTTPRNIEGYELVTIPDNQNGTLYRDSDPVIYEYRRVSSGVTVKYIDKDTGEELADIVTISGLYGDSYETEEKEIEDYELVEVVGDTSGTLEVEEKEVIYYYEKKTGQVVVKYEDIDGNVLDTEEMSDKVGEDYETDAKEIEGYKLVEIPDNQAGTYIDGTIEVTYVYKKLGTIIVKFVDSDGNEIADAITTENVVGEEYYLEAPEIDGYTMVGDKYISTAYIDGELVFVVEYEKIEESVDTSDIQVVALLIIFILSIIMSITCTLKIRKEQI